MDNSDIVISKSEFLAIIKENLELKEDISLELNDRLEVINMNSIIFIQLIISLEQRINMEFDDKHLDFSKYETIGDIYNSIKEICETSKVN